jgi:Ca2+-dependent lipid-binding protein
VYSGLSSKDDVGFIQGTSDPYVEIFAAEGVTGKLRKIGRSGTLTGTNNPSWGEVFEYPFDRRKDQARFYLKN